jgi:beta-exotoxin I transport system permease protein
MGVTMNKTLFLASLKANWKLLLSALGLLLIYQSTIMSMYDPESTAGMNALVASLPEGMVTAFGFDGLASDLSSFIGTYLYGFIFLIIPLIYIVPTANNLIARHVDRGSMVYMLATPNTRPKIARTQGVFLYSSLTLLLIVSTFTGVLIAELAVPGELKIGNYLLLNLVTLSMHLVLCGIAFLASCFFNDSRSAITVALGVPLAFLLIDMMSGFGDKLAFMKYMTLFSVIDVQKIFSDHAYGWWSSLIMLGVAGLLMLVSIRVFDKRSLNI